MNMMNEKYELHALCQFPQEESIAQIKRCLDEGVDINLIDDKGETALSYAIKANALSLVRYLLENKANPNLSKPDAYPPLVRAVIMDSKSSITFTTTLLEYPATDINQYGAGQITALYVAVQMGNAELVELLIKKGAKSINALVNNNYQSLLCSSLHNKHFLIAEKLIHHFPELVNQPSGALNIHPLHQAAYLGLTNLIDMFIDKGADIDSYWKKENVTPLYLAAQEGHDEIVLKLINKGAGYTLSKKKDTSGMLVIPLRIAGENGHVKVVELLLNYTHTSDELTEALTSVFNAMMKCRDFDLRQKIHTCSELIRNKVAKFPALKVLTLDDYVAMDWEKSFLTLFSKNACNEDKYPSDKDSAIRHVLSSMYGLLRNPKACIPYLQHLSSQLELYWQKEHGGQSFPKFDTTNVKLWAHQGLVWPIPREEDYCQAIKKLSLLDKILLDKLQQYGMGEKQSKWTGFIPEDKSNHLLLNNVFFTENRRTMNGLFHGNMHNIQRVILLLAMEAGDISLTYNMDNGQTGILEPKEVFSALVRTDIFFSKKQKVLWGELMDSANEYCVSFTYPHSLHSLLLMNNAFSGTLQDYLLFSFCNNFIKMRQLYNHVYGTTHTNKTLCHELSKLKLAVFSGLPEFAIQMDEKRALTAVKKIDETQENEVDWSILSKQYKPLEEPTPHYSTSLKKQFCLFNDKKTAEQERSNDMLPSFTLSIS